MEAPDKIQAYQYDDSRADAPQRDALARTAPACCSHVLCVLAAVAVTARKCQTLETRQTDSGLSRGVASPRTAHIPSQHGRLPFLPDSVEHLRSAVRLIEAVSWLLIDMPRTHAARFAALESCLCPLSIARLCSLNCGRWADVGLVCQNAPREFSPGCS